MDGESSLPADLRAEVADCGRRVQRIAERLSRVGLQSAVRRDLALLLSSKADGPGMLTVLFNKVRESGQSELTDDFYATCQLAGQIHQGQHGRTADQLSKAAKQLTEQGRAIEKAATQPSASPGLQNSRLPAGAAPLHDALRKLIREVSSLSQCFTAARSRWKAGQSPGPDDYRLSHFRRHPQSTVGWSDIIRGLRDGMADFWRHWDETQGAIDQLPPATLARLEAIGSPAWSDKLRLTCDKLIDQRSLIKKTRGGDPADLELFIDFLKHLDPPNWLTELKELTKAKDELYALRKVRLGDEIEADAVSSRDSPTRPATAGPTGNVPPPPKAKRSTERGEGRAKLISALTNHHKYDNGGCLNLAPVGNNQLARLAGVVKRTASAFFEREFKGHANYRALCNDAHRLVAALKALNGEFRPHHFCDARTPDESEKEDE
jgi:hypothetical protein